MTAAHHCKEIMEEENLNSSQEFAPQESENHAQTQVNEHSEVQPQNAEDGHQDRNWREMRKRQQELEQRLRQKEEMLEKFMSAQLESQTRQSEVVEEPEEPDDEYISAGKVKGIARKSVQPLEAKIQALEARLAQQDQQKHMSSLRSKYSDFDDVVNVETLELLEIKEPELASAIAESKDPYKMAVQSYKYIKALNLVEELPNAKRSKEIKQKLDSNSKTVQSPMAYDKRPMAQAFKTTAADQKKIYEEMMFYASQATGL